MADRPPSSPPGQAQKVPVAADQAPEQPPSPADCGSPPPAATASAFAATSPDDRLSAAEDAAQLPGEDRMDVMARQLSRLSVPESPEHADDEEEGATPGQAPAGEPANFSQAR